MTALVAPDRARVRVRVRLAGPGAVDRHLGALVVWALLAPDLRFDGRVLATAAVFLLGEVCVVLAALARDGGERVRGAPPTGPRALRLATVGALLWAVALVLAPHRPTWAVALVAVAPLFALLRSRRPRPGRRRAPFPAALGWAFVLVPHGLVAGDPDGAVVVQALLFGLGPLLLGVRSAAGDDPTTTAPACPRGGALFVTAVSAVEFLLVCAAPLVGAPWWFPFALLPTAVVRCCRLRVGFARGDAPRARRLDVRAHRLTVAALVAVNLL